MGHINTFDLVKDEIAKKAFKTAAGNSEIDTSMVLNMAIF